MRIFDQIDPQTLEPRERELWWLTLAMILILATSVGLLMYPMVFSRPVPFSIPAMRGIFFGYCVLSVLLVIYLVSRQNLIRRLRRQVAEELHRNALLRRKASADLLASLPKFTRFQDRLSMDFRRALSTQQPLSLLIARLKPAQSVNAIEAETTVGDAANAMLRRLRTEDSIYHFEEGVFGILLPGTSAQAVRVISNRVGEALADASGATRRFTYELRTISYPEQAESARELEEAARNHLTADNRAA